MNEPNSMALGAAGRRWLAFFAISIVSVYGVLFILFLNHAGPKDHDQFLVFHELQLWNSTLFGLAKQWSPVMCSGLSLAGEPQVPFMSLSMALTYAIGPLLGIKLATLLYFIAGWIGAYQYAGLWLKQLGQRALAASLFIGNGFFVCRLGFGHIDFIPFLILPLLLWMLHEAADRQPGRAARGVGRLMLMTLVMGAIVALAIDGSPVSIIHLLLWIGLYAVVLAYATRSLTPLVVLGGAIAIAAVLDAGYLWPMLEAQQEFPRKTEDTFSSAFSLLWFALLPVRGKVLPANGNGHELSVFIGPVIAYLLWTYRRWLARAMPRSMKLPLLVVCLVSIVLGMGSLKVLHVPTWLSPFDMLRPLPGFRSLGVTGRFWGFLALPLSLLGAAALWRFATEFQDTSKLRIWLGAAMLLQLGFQAETMLSQWLGSSSYQSVVVDGQFRRGPEEIEYVTADERYQLQGQLITPTRGVVNCYDMDDFIRADTGPGKDVIKEIVSDDITHAALVRDSGSFVSWNHLRLDLGFAAVPDNGAQVRSILNQAFNSSWSANGCSTSRGDRGNLVVECPVGRFRKGPIDVVFHDELSARAAAVSTSAWQAWLLLLGGLLLVSLLAHMASSGGPPWAVQK